MRTPATAWPGGEHEFELRIGELRALQENCKAGPEEVLNRLRAGTWRVDDIIEPIRLGLIGAGMPAAEAGPMVVKLFDQHPKVDFKFTALTVMFYAVMAPEDDRVGKPEGATSAPENGGSPAFTATGP